MLKKHVFTILFISWASFITILSLFSFSGIDTGGVTIPYADKMVHFLFYLIFAILGCFFLRERTQGGLTIGKAVLSILFTAITYGIFIEVLQYMVTTDRMAEFGDIVANTIGAIAGVSLIKWFFSKERPLKWKI
ncbi:VanZ family protein [Flagellimonas sp. HMM57]|uniref:VanZ family protein n=1 Tax=unclassified Flagellimonas TaxID=2644544 RepID=UPI0013D1A0FE|nr:MULTISPECIES: VanZ family protein [unclassified Flagellimonas]UII76967.1 VanZ family protein [Flagellimonas sp. HMM57]